MDAKEDKAEKPPEGKEEAGAKESVTAEAMAAAPCCPRHPSTSTAKCNKSRQGGEGGGEGGKGEREREIEERERQRERKQCQREREKKKDWNEIACYGHVFLVSENFVVRVPTLVALDSAITRSKRDVVYSSLRVMKHLRAMRLSPGGQRILNSPNAGGTSIYSECMSYEILRMAFSARLVKTEMEIEYRSRHSKITDMLVEIAGKQVAVSVTRAMRFKPGKYDRADALTLLQKKLHGVNVSSCNAAGTCNEWKTQILHVFCESQEAAKMLYHTYTNHITHVLRSNTILFLTVCENARWIFYESQH